MPAPSRAGELPNRLALLLCPEAGVGVVFLLVSLLSILAIRASDGVVLVWPSNVIAALLLIRMQRVRPLRAAIVLLVAGVVSARIAADYDWMRAAGVALVNLLGIAGSYYLFGVVIRYPYPRLTIFQGTSMVFVMGIVLTGITALCGGVMLHLLIDAPLRPTVEQWWEAGALGGCLFGPPVVLYSRNRLARLLRPRFALTNLMMLAACVACTWIAIEFVHFPFVVIAVAPMMAAFQLGSFGASLLSLCTGATITVLWMMGIQPMGLNAGLSDDPLHGLPIIAMLATLLPPIAVGLGTDARRQAARALRASEQRFRESLEHSPLGMIILDRNGHWSFTNESMQKMLGYSAEELADLSIESLAHPDELPDVWERWGRLMSQQVDSYQISRRFRHRDGRWIWTHCAVSLARDGDGVPLHFIAQVESLEERRQAEARLAAERELLRTTLASIGDAVITTDADGAITYMNDAAVRLTGKTFETVDGRSLSLVLDLLEPESGRPAENLLARAIRDVGVVRRAEPCSLQRPDGTVCYVADRVTPVCDEMLRLTGLVVVLHDVTEVFERNRHLHHQANHDPLTDLLNRTAFRRRLHRAFARGQHAGTPGALLALDLDHFKGVNDSGGHAAGDEVLRHVAQTLKRALRPEDAVGRLGGDEFAVLLNDCPPDRAAQIAQRICTLLNPLRTSWDGRVHETGASLGLVQWNPRFSDPEEWFAAADRVAYEAKNGGRGNLRIG